MTSGPTSTAASPARPAKSGAARRRRHPWRTVVASAVTVAVLIAVFAGVFPRFARYSQAWSSIQAMPALALAGLLVTSLINIGVTAWPVQAALPGLRYRPAFVVSLTSSAMSNALPAGGAVGLGVEYEMLASYGFASASAAGASAISNVFNILATLVVPVVGVCALLATGQVRWHFVLTAIVGSLVAVTAVAATAAILHSEGGARKVGHAADRCVAALTRPWRHRRNVNLTGRALAFRSNVVDVLTARWPLVIGSALLPLFTSWSVLLVALRGVEHGTSGTGVTWPESLAAFSFAMVVSFIPVTVGGLGTVDASLTGLLIVFGATGSQALAADIVWRTATYVPQVITGTLTFLWWRVKSIGRRPATAGKEGENPARHPQQS